MLGARPCGIIVLLGELFGAESNSQVYALLHTFLSKNNISTKETRKFVFVYIHTYVDVEMGIITILLFVMILKCHNN